MGEWVGRLADWPLKNCLLGHFTPRTQTELGLCPYTRVNVKRSCTHICLQGATQHIALTAALKLDFGHLRTGKKKKQKKKERKTHRMGPVEKCNWQTVETEKLQREWS